MECFCREEVLLPGLKTSDAGAAEPPIQSPGLLLSTLLLLGTSDLVEKIFGFASWEKRPLSLKRERLQEGSAAAWSLDEEPDFPIWRPGLPSLYPIGPESSDKEQPLRAPFPCVKTRWVDVMVPNGPPSSDGFCPTFQFH